MDEITVATRAQFVAAVQGAAMPTEAQAKRHPFRIKWDTFTYTFGAGVSDARADEIRRNVNRIYGRKRHA